MVTYSADHPIAGSLKPLSIASTVVVIAGRRTSIIELINEIIEPHFGESNSNSSLHSS
jgi:hypothetical protein